ncbi:uroporphyrinogen decarboxylase [Nonomuraea dietziae]|uniref:uroporphyrinogen decarboxylase n=1 Tax=Nonomuraea dietziae TaxID=65515 RepID=UPI0031DD4708
MRQAGRSLPEYLKVREGVPMLTACATPDLIVEITMQPVRRYGVDAAIFFSDIVVPLKAIGVDLDIKPGVGPVIADPIRDRAGLEVLRPLEPGDVPYVTEAIQSLVGELGSTPLIGFAGAPFTLASYLIEGGPLQEPRPHQAMMYGEPALWHALMERLTDIVSRHLRVQIDAGASAIQLFDSWVGAVAPDDYREFVLPYTRRIFEAVPTCRASTSGSARRAARRARRGGRRRGGRRLARAARRGRAARRARQGAAGNLDPAILLAPWEAVERKALSILEQGRSAEGHVFNLGHGVLPSTDPDQLRRLTDLVHSFR